MTKSRKILAALLIAASLLILSGCGVMVETEVAFNEDGSFSSKESLFYSRDYLDQVGETPEEFSSQSSVPNAEVIKKQVGGEEYYGTTLITFLEDAPEKKEKSKTGDNWTASYSTDNKGRKLASFTYTFPALDPEADGETEITDEYDADDLLLARMTVSFPGGVKSVEADEGCKANISGRTAIFEFGLSEIDRKVTATGWLDEKAETDERVDKLIRSNPFCDVSENDPYFDAVVWGYNSDPQITDGNGEGSFMPEQTCTRGQVVTFLWRAAGRPEPKTTENPFTDVTAEDYFYKPVLWALENGITDGITDTTFCPYKTCKNSHVVTFLHRAVEKPDPKDAPEIWYRDALAWAKKNGMSAMTGLSDENIAQDCPRSDVLLYLYRCCGNKTVK